MKVTEHAATESAAAESNSINKNKVAVDLIAKVDDSRTAPLILVEYASFTKTTEELSSVVNVEHTYSSLFVSESSEEPQYEHETNLGKSIANQQEPLSNLECDTIILLNGNTIICKIQEVQEKKVIYHLCCPECAVPRVIKTKEIAMVIKAKPIADPGLISEIKPEENIPDLMPEYNRKALISFWLVPIMLVAGILAAVLLIFALFDGVIFFGVLAGLLMLGIIIGCIYSINMGKMAQEEIQTKWKNKQKGNVLAKLGRIGSTIGLIISGLIIMALVALTS
jgi:hypothetical protein